MRVLVFHGYLLRGTGSNVYNSELAAALVALGHEVHLLAQDPHPEDRAWVDAVGTWDADGLAVEPLREHVSCTVYRPDIGGLLPVYVADTYEGVEARPFPELSDEELERYLALNVTAVREVAEGARPDIALANHLVMGPAILSRALDPDETPYAVKIHGSALEYTVKPHPRFAPYAREGLAAARGILVGSRHTAESLWDAFADVELRDRTRLGPPGVDLEIFRPRPPAEARAALAELAAELRAVPASAFTGSGWDRDEGAVGAALADLERDEDRIVLFVGKFIAAKGIDLLLAAWPLVLARVPAARLALVGFGADRDTLAELHGALGGGDLTAARELAAGPFPLTEAFLADLDSDAEARAEYRASAGRLGERVVWVGRLEHAELARLVPACEAQVVPSTFPEAFGMVAAEAAACGALPVSADHSGLAEVSAALAAAIGPPAAEWLSFSLSDHPVRALAGCLVAWLEAPVELREEVRARLAEEAASRYGWEGVARGVIAAAQGRLDGLASPAGSGSISAS